MLWNANYNFQKFANEIGRMIKYDINLIDTDGRIIASTDQARIGEVHEAACLILDKNLNKLIIDDDTSFRGTKRGINLPIMLQTEIVGVVGITGDPAKVEEYGEIIRKVTQMMLQEEQDKQRERISHTIYKNLICEWLMQVPRDYNDFISRARLLGIEVELDRRCIIFQLDEQHIKKSTERQVIKANDMLEQSIKLGIKAWPNGVYLSQESRCIVLMPEHSSNSIENFCLEIKREIESNTSIKVAIGIGTVGNRIDEMQRSFSEAEQAVNISAKHAGCEMRLYERMNVETLFQNISDETKVAYIKRVMGAMPTEKYPKYMSILEEMYQLNGSITQISTKLFVHKNTLQQWLMKIKDYTGYDPRIIREGMPLYIAMLFFKDLEEIIE